MDAAAAVSCPNDVTDDQRGGPVGLYERVVPVTADAGGLGRGEIADDDVCVVRLRRSGQHAALQLLGQLALLLVEPRVVQGQSRAVGDLRGGGDVGRIDGPVRVVDEGQGAEDPVRSADRQHRHGARAQQLEQLAGGPGRHGAQRRADQLRPADGDRGAGGQ